MNEHTKPTIAAIIVTWNPLASDVVACAERLMLQVDTIIYSDNGSNAETEKLLKDLQSKHENIVCLWNGGNLGIATALNRGVVEARRRGAEWVMTLDHDSVPEKDMALKMFRAYGILSETEKEAVGILCPNFMLVKGPCYANTLPRFIATTITSGQLVKISLFDKIGGYEDDLFVECVDHEFCFRALAHGYRTFLAPDAMLRQRIGNPVIKMLFGKTFIVPNYPPVRYYYQVRNSVYIYIKYFWVVPGWVSENILRLILSLGKMVLYEKDPVRKMGLAILGVADGLRGKLGPYRNSSG
jgi:rhamnosyltransferase